MKYFFGVPFPQTKKLAFLVNCNLKAGHAIKLRGVENFSMYIGWAEIMSNNMALSVVTSHHVELILCCCIANFAYFQQFCTYILTVLFNLQMQHIGRNFWLVGC